MKPEKIVILNNKKEKLVGYLYKGTSKTLIIVCHGLESINNPKPPFTKKIISDYFVELSRWTKADIFSFDFAGFGESEGKHFIRFTKRDSDLKNVLDYFFSRYEKIILYGFSLGGTTVAIAAGRYTNIQGLIAINSFLTLHPKNLYKANIFLILTLVFTNPLYVRELFYMMKHVKADKITIPTIVIHSDKDNFVKSKQSVSFFNSLQTRKKIVLIPSTDHTMIKEYKQLPIEISTWMKEEKL